jgi:hypothetical protein
VNRDLDFVQPGRDGSRHSTAQRERFGNLPDAATTTFDIATGL